MRTHPYFGYGAGTGSERATFNKAVAMMRRAGIITRSAGLDNYYGRQYIINVFDEDATIHMASKENTEIK